MKIVVVLLVVLIAVNFSIAANKDSPKAKKAQNQCKAIVKKLKSKANGQKNELKGKLVASSNKYTAELKKTMSSVSAAFKPLGNQGQALADVFKGNVSIYVNTFNFLLNSKSIDAILLLTLEQLKYTYIDPIQADIHNLTLQINNKTSAYTCFETRMKSLKTIGENVIVQTKPIVLKAEATVKSNISIIIASIESIRTTAVKTLKACKGNEACGVKYYAENNATLFGNLTMFSQQATLVFTQSIDLVFTEVGAVLANTTMLYKNETQTIANCISKA